MTAPKAKSGQAPAPLLLVDDRPGNLVALQAVLSGPEYEVVSVQSGPEALALVASREFAVVLLDLQMPGMDGIETAVEIGRIGDARGRTVPIIFLTATDSPIAHILRAYATGAADFMQKPLEPDIVRAKVQVFVGLFRTQQRLLAEIEERRRVQDALGARDRLLAIVSHDLRNPLNAILLGTTQIQRAARGPHSVDIDRPARAIVRAVSRMSRLVEDLLDLATLDAGQPLSMRLGRHDLAQLALEIMEVLEPIARSTELTLRAEFVAGLYVRCDPQRVQQVLANLIGNAIKFNRNHGSIDVVADRKDDEVIVSVRDTGIGVRPDQVEHIFDPYWKGDPTRKDGAGLGLSIAREIVDAHGGRIWVDRVDGGGCAFSFTLRAAEAAQAIELQNAP
jgi:two-component system sensor histidine kinase/response regulator